MYDGVGYIPTILTKKRIPRWVRIIEPDTLIAYLTIWVLVFSTDRVKAIFLFSQNPVQKIIGIVIHAVAVSAGIEAKPIFMFCF